MTDELVKHELLKTKFVILSLRKLLSYAHVVASSHNASMAVVKWNAPFVATSSNGQATKRTKCSKQCDMKILQNKSFYKTFHNF